MNQSFSRALYGFLHVACRLAFVTVFRGRCFGRENVPSEGGLLVLSNHQSHLDPLLVGLAADRQLCFVARKTLYKAKPLAWIMETLDTIPIDRDGSGLGGLKETLKRLKQGKAVVLFPEGTRTPDGEVQPLKPGFCSIARRASVPIQPVAIAGAFESWPRTRRFPLPAPICVVFGEPLAAVDIERLSDDELVAAVEQRIRECHVSAKELL